MKKLLSTLVAVMFVLFCTAQEQTNTQVATGMNAYGKIYVVLAVVLVILLGLFLYLIRVERKISKLEK